MSECEHEKGLGYEGECVPCLKSHIVELEQQLADLKAALLSEFGMTDQDIAALPQEKGE